jgi:CBS-domain-containing membrane protein
LRQHPPPRAAAEIIWAWLGAFSGIALLVAMVAVFPDMQLLVIGSFGASAVLLFAAPGAPFSQPRNLIGGHLVSAVVGVAAFVYVPDLPIVKEAAAVATAIAAMQLTRTVHPPGGATALIAVIGSDEIHAMGWGFLMPVMMGAVALLLVALISNNLFRYGSFPVRWD